uniref:THAP domain-containing protein 5 n=2 Tax=Nothobranchius pienaari TaxID=704102 RepID=A0A1A8N0A3_9TELE
MPRYCAVKVCRNRGGTAWKTISNMPENKRISFYPFPLQDKQRLQKWVDNMRREEWTPSRHQYLCNEHFTEDCFDIRWGIRYLKSTAIPTIFPPVDDDDKISAASKRSVNTKPSTSDSDREPKASPPRKRPLILRKTCKQIQLNTENTTVTGYSELTSDLPMVPESVSAHESILSETQSTPCEIAGDIGRSIHAGTQPEEQGDSFLSVLGCETLGALSNGVAEVDAASLQAALGQTLKFVPLETLKENTDCCVVETRFRDEEHARLDEHSYCRPDTDKDELWNKILGLHAKILELDRREESTVAKIHALENEIALLKRDDAVFKEKQKLLEDYISSVLL